MDDLVINKITDFIIEHLKYKDRELVRDHIIRHSQYGTIYYSINELGEIIGICRWNISDDEKTAFIIDSAVRKDFRSRGVMKDFLIKALKRFPKITHLEYCRGLYGDKKTRRLPISIILESKKY